MEPRIFKYNPALLTDEELKAHFVVRQTDLEQLLRVIRDNMTDDGNPNQHVMLIGPRGSGKTTLVLRAAIEIRQTPKLDAYWYPLRFPEESYEVASPGEFWLESLDHLARQSGDERWKQTWQELKQETDENRLRERALGQLLDFADQQKRKILLIVENMNMLFGDQLDDDDAWKIRHTLMHESRLMLLGTATSRFEEIEKADKAFYELFKVQQIPPLTSEECNLVWEAVAGKKLDGEKIRAIHILTGGNLRLLTIIAKFGAHYSFRQLLEGLTGLIDEHTEYFKSHLDNLAATERKVYLALAKLWDPSSAREIAQAARLDVNRTSAFLKRLCEKGAVTIPPNMKGRFYMLAERMYNIYYLMRRNGTEGRVKATINFMIGMYGEEEARRLLDSQMERCTPEEWNAILKQFNWFDERHGLPMSREPSSTGWGDDLNDLDKAEIYNIKGDIHFILDSSGAKALEFHNKALAVYEKILGLAHPNTATTYSRIGLVYSRQGDYAKALELYDKALAIREKVLGREHPDTADSYGKIAFVYRAQGDYAKALELYDKALTIREKVLGREHPDTADSYREIAFVYRVQGDYAKGLEFSNKALTIDEKVLAAEHPISFSYFDVLRGLTIDEKVLSTKHLCTMATYSISISDAIRLAVTGQARQALCIIEGSEAEKYLEPLVAGLKLYLGEEVRVAHEIYEVAKDVKARIEKLQAEIEKLQAEMQKPQTVKP